jgi:hypothetical protein
MEKAPVVQHPLANPQPPLCRSTQYDKVAAFFVMKKMEGSHLHSSQQTRCAGLTKRTKQEHMSIHNERRESSEPV